MVIVISNSNIYVTSERDVTVECPCTVDGSRWFCSSAAIGEDSWPWMG